MTCVPDEYFPLMFIRCLGALQLHRDSSVSLLRLSSNFIIAHPGQNSSLKSSRYSGPYPPLTRWVGSVLLPGSLFFTSLTTSFQINKGLSDNLKFIFVDHVTGKRRFEHPNREITALEHSLHFPDAGKVRFGRRAKPTNRLGSLPGFNRTAESTRNREVLFKPVEHV